MKTAYALIAGFWAWLIYTMPTEMGIIGKATVHMFAQVIEIGWGAVIAASFLLIVGCLPSGVSNE